MDRYVFEEKVKRYIEQDGRSQAAVARKLGYAVDTFNRWVRGSNRMPDSAILAFCRLLKLTDQQFAELMTLAGYVAPSSVRAETSKAKTREAIGETAPAVVVPSSLPVAPQPKTALLPAQATLLAYLQAAQNRYAQWADLPMVIDAPPTEVTWTPSPYIHLGEQAVSPYQLYPVNDQPGVDLYVPTYALPLHTTRLGVTQPIPQVPTQEVLGVLHSETHTLLLGDPGSGKTTALERLAWFTAATTLTNPDYRPFAIPLFVRLADYRGEVDLLPLLQRALNRFGLLQLVDAATARRLLWANELHFVLLLDGLNEIKRDYLADALNALRNHLEEFPRHTVHLTCRAAGYEQVVQSLPQLKAWLVQPLIDTIRHWYDGQGQSDVRAYLYRHLGDVNGKLVYDRLHSDARLTTLARLPLFLWMLKEVVAEGGDLPLNRGQLLHAFVHSKRALGSIVDPQLRASTDQAVRVLGWHLQAQGQLALAEHELWPLLVKQAGMHPEDVRQVGETLLRLGLLITTGEGQVQFLHQLVQEYAAAAWLATQADFAERLATLIPEPWHRECVLMALWFCRQRYRPEQLLTLMTTPTVDLQVRLTAGQLLGEIGDPRFPLQSVASIDQPDRTLLFIEPPLVAIPGGVVLLGEPLAARDDELPCQVTVTAFALAVFPVTNQEYQYFIASGGYTAEEFWTADGWAWLQGEGQLDPIAEAAHRREHQELRADVEGWLAHRQATQALRPEDAETWRELATWTEDRYIKEYVRPLWVKPRRKTAYWHEWHLMQPNQPVVGVNWHEAMAYVAWLTHITGKSYRLPTEAEWEWAARRNCRIYPWGDEWDSARCNTSLNRLHQSTPVGIYPNGATPDGLADLAGNVNEWTCSLYQPYPYTIATHEDVNINAPRVIRGGSWFEDQKRVRGTARQGSAPLRKSRYVGFRLAQTL